MKKYRKRRNSKRKFSRRLSRARKYNRGRRSRRRGRNAPMTAWSVFLNGKNIDTIFYTSDMDAEDVRRSLINHDGYDSGIVVRKQRKKRKK